MKHYHFKEVSSTNDYASELLDKDDELIVTADFQTNGRGRNNHSWFGSFGNNVYFSYGIKHKEPPDTDMLISYQLIGCLAAFNVLSLKAKNIDFRLKYPNDVYAKFGGIYSKIAGILVEHTFAVNYCSKSIVGIGINVLQDKFDSVVENNPVSLKMLGQDFHPSELSEPLAIEIQYLQKLPANKIFEEWERKIAITGKNVAVSGKSGLWKAIGILPDARLLLQNHISKEEIIVDNSDSIRYEIR